MTLGNIIKSYREVNGVSMREFSERSGLSKAYISMLERGARPNSGKEINPTYKTIRQAAKGMNMDVDVLFDELDGSIRLTNEKPTIQNENAPGVIIPVIGKIAAGIPIEEIEDVIGTVVISRDLAKRGTHFALQIKGDSMAPTICNGDTIVIRQQADAESGDVVAVSLDGGYATCKKLQKNDTGVTLISYNPAYEPIYLNRNDIENRNFQILGKAVELRRSLI